MKKKKTGLLLAIILAMLLCATTTQAATQEPYRWPAASKTITQKYSSAKHTGLDIGGSYGSSIYATKTGTVTYVYSGCKNRSSQGKKGVSCVSAKCKPSTGTMTSYNGKKCCNYGYGNGVIIKHSDGSGYSMYAHMLAVNVKKGDTVTIGTKIGTMGSTGNSSGVHLHFEMCKSVKISGKYYKPVTSINTNTTSTKYVYSVTPAVALSKSSLLMTAQTQTTLTASTVPYGRPVTWYTSNSSVVSVSNGKLQAKKAGTANITARMTYGGKIYQKVCAVTVKTPNAPTTPTLTPPPAIQRSLKLSQSALTMAPGSSATLTAITTPSGQTVSWRTSNAAVASVSNGRVTAYKAGSANITAQMAYGTTVYQASCVVTVKEQTYTGYIKGTNGSLAINSTPSTQNPIGSIPECAPCTVYPNKRSGNWVWVSYGGKSGYSYITYITTTKPNSATRRITGTDGSLMINRTASAKYPIGSIPEGKTCTVYPSITSGNWIWTSYNGVYGWSYSKYMK